MLRIIQSHRVTHRTECPAEDIPGPYSDAPCAARTRQFTKNPDLLLETPALAHANLEVLPPVIDDLKCLDFDLVKLAIRRDLR